MRRHSLAYLAVCTIQIIGLGGCSTAISSPAPPAPTTTTTGTSVVNSTGSGAVTGTVAWPDGHLAANVRAYFVEGDWHIDTYQPDVTVQLGQDASYSIGNCPCQGLTAYLYVPLQVGADPANGGQDCYILMEAQGTYSGVNANPGDVINWQALNLPCDVSPYPSDQNAVQNEATLLDPSQNDGYAPDNSGSWQNAENRTSTNST